MNWNVNNVNCMVAVATSVVIGAVVPHVHAGSIVQEGSLSGGAGPMVQDVVLEQFDDQGGTLELKSVQLDFLTSIIGGYTTDGSGIAVDIFAQLDAEWSLAGELIADTQALISATVPNTNVFSPTVFNTDTESVVINDPAGLAAWIGPSTIALQVFTQFQVSEDPAGIIFFGAGGTVRYTVTYDFNVVPAPAAGLVMMLGATMISPRRRRR
jgi:hypothetical protein